MVRSRGLKILPKGFNCLSSARKLLLAFVIFAVGFPVQAAPVLVPSQEAAPLVQHGGGYDDGRYQVALSFFERLFGGRQKKKKQAPKSNKPVKKTPVAPVIPTISKDPDATVIAVFGDEFSQDLAWGLKDAFSQVADVRVEIHSVRRTGLIHRAGKNPVNDLESTFDTKPFSFGVVMVGLNDRVKIRETKNEEGVVVSPSIEFKAAGWDGAYLKAIDNVRSAFAKSEKPLYWVGLPPVSNKKLSGDMLYFNDFVRHRLNGRDERYIDIWDAFSNEEGDYSSRGPDLSGQETRLRQKNGIRFNKAGRRKLAFFVEKLVIRVLSQSAKEDVLPALLSSEDETALKEGRGAVRNIYVLRKPPIDSNKLVLPNTSSSQSKAHSADFLSRVVPERHVEQFAWPRPQ